MWKQISSNTYQSLTDKDIYVGIYELDDTLEIEISLYEKFSLYVFECPLYYYSNVPGLIKKFLRTTCQKVAERGKDIKFYTLTRDACTIECMLCEKRRIEGSVYEHFKDVHS